MLAYHELTKFYNISTRMYYFSSRSRVRSRMLEVMAYKT
jgi:hypothetical protein